MQVNGMNESPSFAGFQPRLSQPCLGDHLRACGHEPGILRTHCRCATPLAVKWPFCLTVFSPAGLSKHFVDASLLPAGPYVITLEIEDRGWWSQRLMVR